MDLASLRRGRKVARSSRLVRRWISDLMVDSSLPMLVSFGLDLIAPYNLYFQRLFVFQSNLGHFQDRISRDPPKGGSDGCSTCLNGCDQAAAVNRSDRRI